MYGIHLNTWNSLWQLSTAKIIDLNVVCSKLVNAVLNIVCHYRDFINDWVLIKNLYRLSITSSKLSNIWRQFFQSFQRRNKKLWISKQNYGLWCLPQLLRNQEQETWDSWKDVVHRFLGSHRAKYDNLITDMICNFCIIECRMSRKYAHYKFSFRSISGRDGYLAISVPCAKILYNGVSKQQLAVKQFFSILPKDTISSGKIKPRKRWFWQENHSFFRSWLSNTISVCLILWCLKLYYLEKQTKQIYTQRLRLSNLESDLSRTNKWCP